MAPERVPTLHLLGEPWQHIPLVEAEEAFLVGSDLIHVDMVETRLDACAYPLHGPWTK